MLHDLITSFLAAFAAITPSELMTKVLGIPLDEMDAAASVKVSDAADPKASHSRSCDSSDRLHLPRCDLIRVDVELLRQLSQSSIALDGGKCHLGLEARSVVPARSSAHCFS
jgi:hypothetical protein